MSKINRNFIYETLNNNGVILFQSDTVPGLGFLATEQSIAKVNHIKQRQNNKYYAFITNSFKNIKIYIKYNDFIKNTIERLAEKDFTLIIEASQYAIDHLPKSCLSYENNIYKIAIRIPKKNSITDKIHKASKAPFILTTSANISGHESPSNLSEVNKIIKEKVDLIINIDDSNKKTLSSTVVDLTNNNKIIREGSGDIRVIQNLNFKKKLLCILDGFSTGNPNDPGNAFALAKTTNFDRIFKKYPYSMLECSGKAVGLPEGQMGNSEVGHLTIGSGQIVKQSLLRINDFFENQELDIDAHQIISEYQNIKTDIHFIGLFSNGGIHSNLDHLKHLIKIFYQAQIYLHIITDGRDNNIKSIIKDLEDFYIEFSEDFSKNRIKISSIGGRYWAMDRDNNINRIEKYCQIFQKNIKKSELNPIDYVKKEMKEYGDNYTDEFLNPIKFEDFINNDNNIFFFFNFRADRMRQLPKYIFNTLQLKHNRSLFMTDYFKDNVKTINNWGNCNVIFKTKAIKNTLSEQISIQGLRQLKITETEKYAHLTFFFNGEKEKPFAGEDRILIPSLKVQNYNKTPQMRAQEIYDQIAKAIKNQKHDVVICNFSNCDMIGHTGDIEAGIKTIEILDKIIGKIEKISLKYNYTTFITADHGNIEEMLIDGKKSTQHSKNPVPFIVISNDKIDISKMEGLKDIAKYII